MDQLYLKKIKDKIDDFIIRYGFGEVRFKITIKNGKILFIEWNDRGKEKVDIK